MSGHLYLIDGSSYIFRAFFSLPAMERDDGTPIGAVKGFSAMLLNLLQKADPPPSHIAVIFDHPGQNYRHRLYPEYKANRPPRPEELTKQFPLVREAAPALSVEGVELEGYEADDLIAAYAFHGVQQGLEVVIVSGDKDFMQLVSPEITMLDTMKGVRFGEDEVKDRFGVPPSQVADVLALAGDTADNVPGVPGIGAKTAAKLIEDYGDLDKLFASASEITQKKRRESLIANEGQARISRALVELDGSAPMPVPIDDLAMRPFDKAKALEFCDKMEFTALARDIQGMPDGV